MNRWFRNVLAIASMGAIASCTFRVAPPAAAGGDTVFVADHGYHASLLLPDSSGQWFEYAYGEFDWFALDRDAPWRIVPALCWPTEGALGRRSWRFAKDVDAAGVAAQMRVGSAIGFSASKSKVRALRQALDEYWELSPRPAHHNPSLKLDFVPSPDSYSVAHNCNSVLVEWLRSLSCEVSGYCAWASFALATTGDRIEGSPVAAARTTAPGRPPSHRAARGD